MFAGATLGPGLQGPRAAPPRSVTQHLKGNEGSTAPRLRAWEETRALHEEVPCPPINAILQATKTGAGTPAWPEPGAQRRTRTQVPAPDSTALVHAAVRLLPPGPSLPSPPTFGDQHTDILTAAPQNERVTFCSGCFRSPR